MMVRRIAMIVLWFAGLAASTLSQSHGMLLGSLRDAEVGQPIAGATIRIMPLRWEMNYKTTGDANGQFVYVGLPAGPYIVTITKDGYAPIDVFGLIIENAETTRLNLTMTKADRAPFKRQLVRYRRPLIDTDSATIKHVYRSGVY
jgi:hypothetical protein